MKSSSRKATTAFFFLCCSGGRHYLTLGFQRQQRGAATGRRPSLYRYSQKSSSIFRRMISSSSSSSSSFDSSSATTCTAFPSVADFLKQTASSVRPPPPPFGDNDDDGSAPRLTLGNPAGDADSIVSSIGLAYLDTVIRRKPTVPIISIPLEDLKSLRPETRYLLKLSGVTDFDRSSFLTIDHPDGLPDVASVTLVDHNQLTLTEKSSVWKVGTILDHHLDEGYHTDTCSNGDGSEDRMIAFDASTSSALVASTCTLLVEQWKKYVHVPTSMKESSDAAVPIPPSLSILLLGVILLDSVNLSVQAGKVTARDRKAVETLIKETDWGALQLPSNICGDEDGQDEKTGASPDLTKLFDTLQNQKFQPEFWNGLTALQALKLDYKSFTVERGKDPNNNLLTFGVSSVLQSMPEFLEKSDVFKSIADEYLLPTAQKFFGIMFMTVENGSPKRQILLSSFDESLVQSLVRFLEKEGSLQIQLVNKETTKDLATGLYRVTMEQGNAKGSRKQVAPILMDFLRNAEDSKQ